MRGIDLGFRVMLAIAAAVETPPELYANHGQKLDSELQEPLGTIPNPIYPLSGQHHP